MRTRVFGAFHSFILVIAVSGCASHHGVTTAEITPRTELRIRFDTARAVVFAAPEAQELMLTDVMEVQGRMIAATADSIRIGASSAKLGGGVTQRFGTGTTTMIAVSGARFEKVQRHTGRTIALVGILLFGAALLIAVATYKEPPPPPPPEPKPK